MISSSLFLLGINLGKKFFDVTLYAIKAANEPSHSRNILENIQSTFSLNSGWLSSAQAEARACSLK